MPPSEPRYFLCTGQCVKYEDLHLHPHAHIIGDLRYLVDEGRKVTAMALWETSIPADEVPPLNPEIVIYCIGDSRKIRCRHKLNTPNRCKHEHKWEISKAGFLALMDRMGLQDKWLELEKQEIQNRMVNYET